MVGLGDDKQMEVDGKGTIGITTSTGDVKILNDVQFVPNLAHNLVSVGQLMTIGYKLIFDDDSCTVIHKKSSQTIVDVKKTQNNMFPIEVSNVESKALVAKGNSDNNLWHLRYGHLNVNGLRLLSKKEKGYRLAKNWTVCLL